MVGAAAPSLPRIDCVSAEPRQSHLFGSAKTVTTHERTLVPSARARALTICAAAGAASACARARAVR